MGKEDDYDYPTLKDGSQKEYAEANPYTKSYWTSVKDWHGQPVQESRRRSCRLKNSMEKDCEASILTANDEKGLAPFAIRRLTFLRSGKNLYPEAKLAIGPSIDTGFLL